jgi:hypothetical protein
MTDLNDGSEIDLGRGPDEWALARVVRSVAGVVERRGWDADTAKELLEMLGVDDTSAVKKARSGLRASRIERRGIGYTQRRSVHRAFHLREQPMPKPDVEVTVQLAVELDEVVEDRPVYRAAEPGLIASDDTLSPEQLRECEATYNEAIESSKRDYEAAYKETIASSAGLEVGTQWARAVVVGADAVISTRLYSLDEVLAMVGLTRANLAPDVKLCKKGLHALDGDNVVRRPDRTTIACRACEKTRKHKATRFNAELRAKYRAQQGG